MRSTLFTLVGLSLVAQPSACSALSKAEGRQSPAGLAILLTDIGANEIAIDKVSLNFKHVLVRVSGNRGYQPGIIVGDTIQLLKQSASANSKLIDIANDGTVLGNYAVTNVQLRNFSGTVMHSFICRGDAIKELTFRWPVQSSRVPLDLPTDMTGFAFDVNSQILARTDFGAKEKLIVGGRNGWRVVLNGSPLLNRLTARTQVGFAGSFESLIHDGVRSYGNSLAGYLTDAGVSFMEVPNGTDGSWINSASSDGHWISGNVSSVGRVRAVIWKDGAVCTWLESADQPIDLSSCSADGALFTGRIKTIQGDRAVIWRSDHGLQTVEDLVREEKSTVPAGWSLTEGVAVSPDGRIIVGNAVDMSGRIRPFRYSRP